MPRTATAGSAFHWDATAFWPGSGVVAIQVPVSSPPSSITAGTRVNGAAQRRRCASASRSHDRGNGVHFTKKR